MTEETERLMPHNRRSEHYHRFSDGEVERRWENVRGLMREEGVEALVIYGNSGIYHHNQVNIHYLTNYRGGFMTYLIAFADADEPPTLFTGLSNHLQEVREISNVEDIRLMLPDPPERLIERLEAGNVSGDVGLVGLAPRYGYSIPHGHHRTLETGLDGELVDLTELYLRMHTVKSEEEIKWVRKAAELTDHGLEALVEAAEPGVKEYELVADVKHAFHRNGGDTSFTVLSTSPMADPEPGECIPWKAEPSSRQLKEGDIITNEITAQFGGYVAQVHRPIAIGQPPTERYREIYELLETAYREMVDALRPGNTAADVAEALDPIEASEYKIYDVLVHGFGNGYLPPFIGTHDSNYWPGGPDPVTESWVFEENMVIVVQPNVFTADERYGFQLGGTVVIREHGPEVLQDFPMEFVQTS